MIKNLLFVSIYMVFFCSFGGVQQASKITGPRKRPSQSPSMRLLGMLHIADPDGGFPKDRLCKLVCTLISFYFVTCHFFGEILCKYNVPLN